MKELKEINEDINTIITFLKKEANKNEIMLASGSESKIQEVIESERLLLLLSKTKIEKLQRKKEILAEEFPNTSTQEYFKETP